MAYKLTTILVEQAARELNMSESEFRTLLRPLYKNWKTVKRIKYGYFEVIKLDLEVEKNDQLRKMIFGKKYD